MLPAPRHSLLVLEYRVRRTRPQAAADIAPHKIVAALAVAAHRLATRRTAPESAKIAPARRQRRRTVRHIPVARPAANHKAHGCRRFAAAADSFDRTTARRAQIGPWPGRPHRLRRAACSRWRQAPPAKETEFALPA